jgi:hypothetical protein
MVLHTAVFLFGKPASSGLLVKAFGGSRFVPCGCIEPMPAPAGCAGVLCYIRSLVWTVQPLRDE